jgi:hypothetical protein
MDKTPASLMLSATGKCLTHSSQQRIQIREPLVRLYKDIETFQYRAVTDTLETIEKMESARTAYRAGLLWMKDVSQKLDPDTYTRLEKFRRVQAHVRRSKMRFEKIKIDTHQKIDMLSASRINLFSHSLALYQKGWLAFFEKTSQTMNAVSEAFTGFQYFEFTVLKELRDPTRKAIDEANYRDMEEKLTKIFGEEATTDRRHHHTTDKQQEGNESHPSKEEKRKNRRKQQRHQNNHGPSSALAIQQQQPCLLDLDTPQEDLLKELEEEDSSPYAGQASLPSSTLEGGSAPDVVDFLSSWTEDDKELLCDIFTEKLPSADLLTPDSSCQLRSVSPSYLPSQLLAEFDNLGIQSQPDQRATPAQASAVSKQTSSKKEGDPLQKWLNLFAEIDPLTNPDAIGRDPSEHQEDRNC